MTDPRNDVPVSDDVIAAAEAALLENNTAESFLHMLEAHFPATAKVLRSRYLELHRTELDRLIEQEHNHKIAQGEAERAEYAASCADE